MYGSCTGSCLGRDAEGEDGTSAGGLLYRRIATTSSSSGGHHHSTSRAAAGPLRRTIDETAAVGSVVMRLAHVHANTTDHKPPALTCAAARRLDARVVGNENKEP